MIAEVLAQVWRGATSTQERPAPEVVLGLALVALALVVVKAVWPVTRLMITITHEGAHGLAALLTGRRLRGINLNRDTSGFTVSQGKPRGPGMVITLAAGYLGPAVVGLAAALLLADGRALGLLWLIVVMLGLMLLQIRNGYGFLILFGAGAAMVAVSWFLPATVQSAIAYLITWVLLIAAPKPVLELIAQRCRGRTPTSDVDQLKRLTKIPGALWSGLFLLANLAGLGVGLVLLVPSVFALFGAPAGS